MLVYLRFPDEDLLNMVLKSTTPATKGELPWQEVENAKQTNLNR